MKDDNESPVKDKWYTRPVFSVKDVQESLRYYCDLLGFEQTWKYEERDQTIVTQVNKGEFELILTQNLDRVGMARVFVELEAAELHNFRRALSAKQIPSENTHWGYPVIRLRDPDGNELLFPLEEDG